MNNWTDSGRKRLEAGEYVELAVRKLLGAQTPLPNQSRNKPDIYTGSIVGEIKAVNLSETRIAIRLDQLDRYVKLVDNLNRSSMNGCRQVSLAYYFALYKGEYPPSIKDVYALGGKSLTALKKRRKIHGNYYVRDKVLERTNAARERDQLLFCDGKLKKPPQEERAKLRGQILDKNSKGLCIRFGFKELQEFCYWQEERNGVPFHYDSELARSLKASGRDSGLRSALSLS